MSRATTRGRTLGLRRASSLNLLSPIFTERRGDPKTPMSAPTVTTNSHANDTHVETPKRSITRSSMPNPKRLRVSPASDRVVANEKSDSDSDELLETDLKLPVANLVNALRKEIAEKRTLLADHQKYLKQVDQLKEDIDVWRTGGQKVLEAVVLLAQPTCDQEKVLEAFHIPLSTFST